MAICAVLLLSSCRKDDPVTPSEPVVVNPWERVEGDIQGFFLLNEGNMGSNKASLDHYDYRTGIYTRNIFGERNPNEVKELGDVGNDLKIYGNKLYATINNSNYLEIMDAGSVGHLAKIAIPNCRYIAFKGRYAYVSAYAGAVQTGGEPRPGLVVRIDTATLQTVGECTVGYQPEEMAVVGGKLYVANSGGYLAPDYDRTVSVIDLTTFKEIKKIDVAINLHRLEPDNYGNLWVSSRGNEADIPSKTFVIDTTSDTVTDSFDDLPASNMTLHGDRLYIYSNQWSYITNKNAVSYAIVDTRTKELLTTDFITDGTQSQIEVPYGLAIHPASGDILVTDARNYVAPGTLRCYGADGVLRWSVTTGDIPAHIVFTTKKLLPVNPTDPSTGGEGGITKVFDFRPAAGQFVNELPRYEAGDSQEAMNRKVLASIGNDNRGIVSLGGFGGYVVFGFEESVANSGGGYDFQITGNSHSASSEPGIVWVMQDENGDGLPGETWFELKGSEHGKPETTDDYWITYHRPSGPSMAVEWEDSLGERGTVDYLPAFHKQEYYYPQWIEEDSYTLHGTRLRARTRMESENLWISDPFDWGYADNFSSLDRPSGDNGSGTNANRFRLSDAVTPTGSPASLSHADFVKVQTAVNGKAGWTGELSTEISGAKNLNPLK